jgi:hypothetical protein
MARTQAAVVGSRRMTACVKAWPATHTFIFQCSINYVKQNYSHLLIIKRSVIEDRYILTASNWHYVSCVVMCVCKSAVTNEQSLTRIAVSTKLLTNPATGHMPHPILSV